MYRHGMSPSVMENHQKMNSLIYNVDQRLTVRDFQVSRQDKVLKSVNLSNPLEFK